MIRKVGFILFSLVCFVNAAIAGPYIDQETKQDDIDRESFVSKHRGECIDMKSYEKSKECIQTVLAEANTKYPKRGTEDYAQKKYAGISKDEAYNQLVRLEELAEKAKGNSTGTYSREPGEISTKQVSNEGWWIQNNILGVPDAAGNPWFKACKNQPTSSVVVRCDLGE